MFKLTDIHPKDQDSCYLILESQPLDKNTSRTIHLLSHKDPKDSMTYNIGRGHEAEVRVNDISVSRFHAMIKYLPNKGFFLEDNFSKFGTIVSLKNSYSMKDG